jgi:hypothetical protein
MAGRKNYVVFYLAIQDDPPKIAVMNGEQIRQLVKELGGQEGIAIVDGVLIKQFDSNKDLSKL